jgi:predicted N-acyltransferase
MTATLTAAREVTTTQEVWRCQKHRAISHIAGAWDQLVPASRPYLRSGMLAAVEQGGIYQDPTYLLLYRGAEPAAVAFVYSLPADTVKSAPEFVRRMVARVRERAPGFLFRTMRVCGSPISNCCHGISFSPLLTRDGRRQALREISHQMLRDSHANQSIYFREFTDSDVADFAGELEGLGYFRVNPWPNMAIEIHWKTFDEYLAALRKRYRKRVRDDMATSSALEFVLLDSFAELAPTARRLYNNVLSRADYNLETLTEGFFAAVSDLDSAKLLIARRRDTGEALGINLLLFGDSQMQNLFIGFDYERNQQFNLYFSLVEHSLRLAIERGCTVAYFGQDSYEFKSRLGAKPVPLSGFMKHPVWPIHWLLRASRHQIFPPCEAPTHDVFQGQGKEE